jgi:prepilin-type N-terminal cleavage/methylation domain-containing protein
VARKLDPDAGFTLIELMVVVAVLSVLAVGVTITALRSDSASDSADMAWFEAQFNQYQSLAITSGHSYGIFVGPKDLRIARRQASGWNSQDSARKWRGKVSIANLSPRYKLDRPDILLLATGQASTFDIAFGSKNACRSDGWAGLTCTTK